MSSGCYCDMQEVWCGGTFVSISSFLFKQVHVLTITVILFTGAVIAVKCSIYTNWHRFTRTNMSPGCSWYMQEAGVLLRWFPSWSLSLNSSMSRYVAGVDIHAEIHADEYFYWIHIIPHRFHIIFPLHTPIRINSYLWTCLLIGMAKCWWEWDILQVGIFMPLEWIGLELRCGI